MKLRHFLTSSILKNTSSSTTASKPSPQSPKSIHTESLDIPADSFVSDVSEQVPPGPSLSRCPESRHKSSDADAVQGVSKESDSSSQSLNLSSLSQTDLDSLIPLQGSILAGGGGQPIFNPVSGVAWNSPHPQTIFNPVSGVAWNSPHPQKIVNPVSGVVWSIPGSTSQMSWNITK